MKEPTPIELGMELGGYELVQITSWEPATHTVYGGRSQAGREVVVKVISARLTADRQYKRWFQRVAKARASLDGPNLLPFLTWGESYDRLYFVLARPPGPNLAEELADVPYHPERAIEVITEVAAGVTAGHGEGLVYRGLDSNEVWVPYEGEAMVGDFGIARPWSGTLAETTRVNHGVTPEELDEEDRTMSGDVYGIGCLLVEALTGEPPFPGTEPHHVAHAHLVQEPPRVTERQPDLPSAIDDVIFRVLSKEPEERYADPAQLIVAAAEALGVDVPVAGRSENAALVAAPVPDAPAEAEPGDGGEPEAEHDGAVVTATQVTPVPDAPAQAENQDETTADADEDPPADAAGANGQPPADAETDERPAPGRPQPRRDLGPAPDPPRFDPAAEPVVGDTTRPRRGLFIGALLAVVLAMGAAGYLLGNSGGDESASAPPASAPADSPGQADAADEAEWLAAVAPATQRLSTARAAGRRTLATADTNAGQARAATGVARAYDGAANTVAAAPGDVAGADALVDSMRSAASAYRQLAAAVRSKNASRYRRAAARAIGRDADVQDALDEINSG